MEAIIEYVCGALLIITLIVGGLAYYYHGEVETLQTETVDLTTKLRQSEANILLAQKSCKATDDVTSKVADKIEGQQNVMTQALVDLATTQSTVVEDTSNDSTAKNYADDARLSPELMRVLNSAYCGASPSDTACSTK